MRDILKRSLRRLRFMTMRISYFELDEDKLNLANLILRIASP